MPTNTPAETTPNPESPAPRESPFLMRFYKVFALCGGIGVVAVLAACGRAPAFSFALGVGSMALILLLWQFTLRFTLKPKHTSWQWETFLVFVRYGLLGGFFYAMISLLTVRWPWFIAGTATILPGLLITILVFDEPSETT